MSEEELIDNIKFVIGDLTADRYNVNFVNSIKGLLDLYQKEKEKNQELEKQNKILEVEKIRYNIQYLESNISQTPDTAMVYHSMKKHLETLKEEKIKLEAELEKKDKIIDKMAHECSICTGRYENMEDKEIIKYFTKKVGE